MDGTISHLRNYSGQDGSQTMKTRAEASRVWAALLPKDMQAVIVAKLPPLDAARASMANHSLKALIEKGPQWRNLLVGPSGEGPLPEKPKQAVSVLIAGAITGPASRKTLQAMHSVASPPPLHELLTSENLWEAQLLEWQESETKAGNTQAAEAAGRISEARNISGTCLDLSYLPIRTLPPCIGQLANLQLLNLIGCANLAALPDSIGQIRQLRWLILRDCPRLSALPDSICRLTHLEWLDLNSAKPRDVALPALLERPGLIIDRPIG